MKSLSVDKKRNRVVFSVFSEVSVWNEVKTREGKDLWNRGSQKDWKTDQRLGDGVKFVFPATQETKDYLPKTHEGSGWMRTQIEGRRVRVGTDSREV